MTVMQYLIVTRLQGLILLFKIKMSTRKYFF